MGVRLRYLSHDLEMPLGEFVVGRSTTCQLSLDDALVSRRHAVITVANDGATVEDLGSRNGVLVNGKRTVGAHDLRDGDEIAIGGQKMTIFGVLAPEIGSPSIRKNRMADTMMALEELREDMDDPTHLGHLKDLKGTGGNPDKRVNALTLVGAVADKALALSRVEDAEKLLEKPLQDLLARAGSQGIDPELAQHAAQWGLRLAVATNKGRWLDYVFSLYTALDELLPQKIVDELYDTVRKVRVDRSTLTKYVDQLRDKRSKLGPSERFLLKRIEGLEPLSALK